MNQEAYFIGVSGGSGSGKTCFINDLKAKCTNQSVCFISLDDYYHPRDKQETDQNGIKNFDLPESIDSESLYQDIQKLKSGEHVTKEEYTFNNEQKEGKDISYTPSKIYIIEGLFIYHYKKLNALFDLKLFIDAREVSKVIRRVRRDRLERNYPLEDVLYRYEKHVMPSYDQFISLYKKDVDIVINNNRSYDTALEVVYAYIEKRLHSA